MNSRPSTHGQLRELRRELNALVSIAHHRTGKPHGWIHNELRRICGGPPIAAATTDQLKARIEAVRTLQAYARPTDSSPRCFSELSRCCASNGGNWMCSRTYGGTLDQSYVNVTSVWAEPTGLRSYRHNHPP